MPCYSKVDRFILPSGVVEQEVLSDATRWCRAWLYSVGSRLVCLWLLRALGIYVTDAPLNAGKIDQP